MGFEPTPKKLNFLSDRTANKSHFNFERFKRISEKIDSIFLNKTLFFQSRASILEPWKHMLFPYLRSEDKEIRLFAFYEIEKFNSATFNLGDIIGVDLVRLNGIKKQKEGILLIESPTTLRAVMKFFSMDSIQLNDFLDVFITKSLEIAQSIGPESKKEKIFDLFMVLSDCYQFMDSSNGKLGKQGSTTRKSPIHLEFDDFSEKPKNILINDFQLHDTSKISIENNKISLVKKEMYKILSFPFAVELINDYFNSYTMTLSDRNLMNFEEISPLSNYIISMPTAYLLLKYIKNNKISGCVPGLLSFGDALFKIGEINLSFDVQKIIAQFGFLNKSHSV